MLVIISQITRTYPVPLVPKGAGPDFRSVALAGGYRLRTRLQEIFPTSPSLGIAELDRVL